MRPEMMLRLQEVLADIGLVQITTGFMAFLFAATGPLAIILSVGQQGGLSAAQLSSFVFGVFTINGLLTIGMSWAYRMPIALFWTIPGTVIIGPALKHLSYAEVIGAFYMTSLLVFVLGWSGLVQRIFKLVPMPIVMAMVAGLFMKFGLDIVKSLHQDFILSAAMVVVFFGLMSHPRLVAVIPPLIGACVVGIVIALARSIDTGLGMLSFSMIEPVFTIPVLSVPALLELVVPLAITILVVQNGQGHAVMAQSHHKAPLTSIAMICGLGGILSASVGAIGTALTGPTTALITSTGPSEKHYATAIMTAIFAIIFGFFAPTFTQLMLASPIALILTLGGLAMSRALLNSFLLAFKGPFGFGALVCFIVTISDLPLFNIGSAFWGLVSGVIVSFLVERNDF